MVAIPAAGAVALPAAGRRGPGDRHRALPRRAVAAGSVYELGGPDYLTYPQIVDAVMAADRASPPEAADAGPAAPRADAGDRSALPIFPVSHDQVLSLGRPNHTDLDAFRAHLRRAAPAVRPVVHGDRRLTQPSIRSSISQAWSRACQAERRMN